MTESEGAPILLFDGVCNVCNAAVQFVVEHERGPVIRFASLQSALGERLVKERQLPGDVSTLIVIDGNRAYTKSTAALFVLKHVKAPWRWLRVLWIVPRPLRDLGYTIFARLRYRLFGKRESCMVPTPGLRARFLG